MTLQVGQPDVERFVEAHLVVRSKSGSEWSVLCPSHGDRNASMRINVAKGAFMCHGCGIKGGMIRLGKLVGVTWSPGNSEEMSLVMLQSKLATLRKGGVAPARILPESSLVRYRNETDYWTGRGLTDETIDAFDLGYDPIENAATIPIRNVHGHLLGVTRRALDFDAEDDESGPKYHDPFGFRKADNLFGSWMAAVDESPRIVLVEGLVDTMKVWQAGHSAVGQYGSYITPRQIRLLRQLGTLEIVMFYDNDKGGRKATDYSKGWTTNEYDVREYDPSHDLRKYFVVRRAVYRVSAKDPGAMTDAQIDRAISEARVVR